MDDLVFGNLVDRVEMGNVQFSHRLNGQDEGLIAVADTPGCAEAFSCGPQRSEDLRPGEPLTFTMIAETHRIVPRPVA